MVLNPEEVLHVNIFSYENQARFITTRFIAFFFMIIFPLDFSASDNSKIENAFCFSM